MKPAALAIWVAVVAALVGAFNLLPRLPEWPFAVLAAGVVALLLVRAKKTGALARGLDAKLGTFNTRHFLVAGPILILGGFLYFILAIPSFRNVESEAVIFALLIGPAMLFIAGGAVCLGIAIYQIMNAQRR